MSSNRPYILVVDDAKEIRDLIGRLYQGEGYEVMLAQDGTDALEKLRASPTLPEVILLDLMMPGMDGFQFREVQKHDARLAAIPVLVMTADANADEKAAKVGAQGYLRKPVQLKVLLAVAEKFLKANS